MPTYNGKTNCTMSEGASGIEVETLQRTLVKCYNQPIDIDGIFGPATKKHLGYAQNMTYPDLAGDGIYGPETAKYLSHYAVKDGKQHRSPQVS